MPRPQYRRFGFVDFDAMAILSSSEDADEFVCRRDNGDNVRVTRADIIAGVALTFPLRGPNGSAAAPTYSFAADPDTGVFRQGTNRLGFAVNGIAQFVINPTELTAVVAGGPLLRNFDSTAIIPNIVSDSGDVNTGIGSAGADQLSFIAGGVEGIRVTEIAAAITVAIAGDTTVTGDVLAADAAGPAMLNEAASAVNPTLLPNKANPTTGIGQAGADQLSFIAGGVEGIRVTEIAAAITVAIAGDTTVTGDVLAADAAGPAMLNEAASAINPTLLPNKANPTTGIGQAGATSISVISSGVEDWRIGGTLLQGIGAGGGIGSGPALFNRVPTSAIGTLMPNRSDLDTGIGWAGADSLSLIAGAIEGLRITAPGAGVVQALAVNSGTTSAPAYSFIADTNTGMHRVALDELALVAGGLSCMSVQAVGGARRIGFYVTAPIDLQTGVAVTDVGIHAALVALGLITA